MSMICALAGLLLGGAPAALRPCDVSDLSWTARLPWRSKGYGVVTSGNETTPKDWVEPNAPGAFGVGFDTYNPKTDDIFNGDGNIEGRPEREVSLHLNGREIANRLCPAEMKTNKPVRFRVKVSRVVGGSDVSVWVAEKPVYDHYFVPELVPVLDRWRTGGEATVDDLRSASSGSDRALEEPKKVTVFDATNDIDHQSLTSTADLPASVDDIGRVVGTLKLANTPKGIDPWDRLAQIWVTDENGERFEILRYITPYRKAWEWKVDLTDYLPLLHGKKKFDLACETWGAGWKVTFTLDYYRGSLKRRPFRVVNLWTGTAVIGQASHPLDQFFVPKHLTVDPKAKWTEARITVTGHGMDPNAKNAAEFLPLWRKLWVDTTAIQNNLWKEDCYLNPCRPQGGTWKFDRAGWGPGDVVRPWKVDLSKLVRPGHESTLRYEIEPYENPTPADGNPARHVIEAQAVFYR